MKKKGGGVHLLNFILISKITSLSKISSTVEFSCCVSCKSEYASTITAHSLLKEVFSSEKKIQLSKNKNKVCLF